MRDYSEHCAGMKMDKKISFRTDSHFYERVEKRANKEERSIADFVRRLLVQALRLHEEFGSLDELKKIGKSELGGGGAVPGDRALLERQMETAKGAYERSGIKGQGHRDKNKKSS